VQQNWDKIAWRVKPSSRSKSIPSLRAREKIARQMAFMRSCKNPYEHLFIGLKWWWSRSTMRLRPKVWKTTLLKCCRIQLTKVLLVVWKANNSYYAQDMHLDFETMWSIEWWHNGVKSATTNKLFVASLGSLTVSLQNDIKKSVKVCLVWARSILLARWSSKTHTFGMDEHKPTDETIIFEFSADNYPVHWFCQPWREFVSSLATRNCLKNKWTAIVDFHGTSTNTG